MTAIQRISNNIRSDPMYSSNNTNNTKLLCRVHRRNKRVCSQTNPHCHDLTPRPYQATTTLRAFPYPIPARISGPTLSASPIEISVISDRDSSPEPSIAEESTPQTSIPSKTTQRSDIWKYFMWLVDSEGKRIVTSDRFNQVICKLCTR